MFLDRTGCLDRTLFCLKACPAFLSFIIAPKNLSRFGAKNLKKLFLALFFVDRLRLLSPKPL